MKNIIVSVAAAVLFLTACSDDPASKPTINGKPVPDKSERKVPTNTPEKGTSGNTATTQLQKSKLAAEEGRKEFLGNISYLSDSCAQFSIIDETTTVVDFSRKQCPANNELIAASDLDASLDYVINRQENLTRWYYDLVLVDASNGKSVVVGNLLYELLRGFTVENLCNHDYATACKSTPGGNILIELGY